jgi:hypothetical protein
MNWYYAENNEQKGPVSEEDFEQLAASGTITPQTLVWHEGMAAWSPYSTVAPQPSAPAAVPGPGMARCSECGQFFPTEQLILLANRWVCGACKPVAVQKLQEGVVGFGQTADPEELGLMIEQRGYDFTIGSVIGRAWELVKGNFWPCIGVTLLCYLIMMGASQIPLLGLLAAFLVQPQILAGLYWYFLKQFRGEEAVLNDAFEGFRRGFGQQAIYMLIMFGVMFACMVPVGIVAAVGAGMAKSGGAAQQSMPVLMITGIVLVVLVAWYFMLCWIFAPMLILDKGLKATEAMKLSRRAVKPHFWKIVGLFLVLGLLGMLSLLALIVGVFVMLPVAFAAITRLYEDVFGEAGARVASNQ